MASPGSIRVHEEAAESGTSLIEADAAHDRLFNKILDQLSGTRLFSSSIRAPNIFIVYAHDNDKEGAAHDECVRKIIIWLGKIHAPVLSDQSPLPPLKRRHEGDDAIRNILANQLCLLPPKSDSTGKPTFTSVDKVVVFGSEVLERYYEKPSALSYVRDIVQICHNGTEQPTITLQSRIHDRVETECNKNDFHHILTELAFLEFRKSVLPQTHGMVPVVLSQRHADDAPMRYLPMFHNTHVKLKLKSPEAVQYLHRLFFKLLVQLFPDDRDFITAFKDCYDSVSSLLEAEDETPLSTQELDDIMNQHITRVYQEYWSLSCVLVMDGKLQAYSGKLSDQVFSVLRKTDLNVQHKILKWLSPISAPELHGRFLESGTARIEGTCDWVIKDRNFQDWYASNGSTLLLLRAEMGMGKTYSTSRVVDWIKQGLSTNDNHEAFAYFYCNKQDPMRREPKEILRNIIRQMATGPWREGGKSETIHETVHDLWETSQGTGISSTFAQWQTCLLALIDTYPRTTIVLDGFDECEEEGRKELIELFETLATRPSEDTPVKLFVSTRPQDDVLQYLDKYPAIQMKHKHNADDIETFVRTKIAAHSRWYKMSEDFRIKVIRTLLEKSGEMFLYAALQITHLLRCKTQPALEDRLEKLPDSLEKTYEQIYQNATAHPDEKKLLDRALKWVMCSLRPLTTKELRLAISQDSESDTLTEPRQDVDEELILVLSQNLLSLEGDTEDEFDHNGIILDYTDSPEREDNSVYTVSLSLSSRSEDDNEWKRGRVWRLAHQAVAEFFETGVYCNTDLAHYEIGKVCLMVLINTFCDEPALSSRTSEDWGSENCKTFLCPCKDRRGPHGEMKNSFVEYAIWAWPTHVRAQEHREVRTVYGLSKKLQKFLGEPEKGNVIFKRWMEHVLENPYSIYNAPKWSIFGTRSMPKTGKLWGDVKPISLACYLGIYTTLTEWWDRTSFDENLCYTGGTWTPWWQSDNRFAYLGYIGRLRPWWSLVALACVHDEVAILKRLLDRGARINSVEEEEVPPIVVAAVKNSVESANELLQRGSDMCSPFTRLYGHILHFALSCPSLEVTGLLLNRVFNDPREVEGILADFRCMRFLSAAAFTLLLDMGVNVNARLRDGTLLETAVRKEWEGIVRRLLDEGADVNTQVEGGYHRNVLEAAACNHDWSIINLLVERGARGVSRAITLAFKLQIDGEKVLRLLSTHSPDLNETWTDEDGNDTSGLIEAVRTGNVDNACLLIQHGADVNLRVRGDYGDALSTVLWAIRNVSRYPIVAMIKALEEAGASPKTLEGDRLNIALADAAYAGKEDAVQYFLARGASPNEFSAHEWTTALCAAAASRHHRASDIIQMLIDHSANVNVYIPAFGDHEWHGHRLALDCPLRLLLRPFGNDGELYNWLKSTDALLSKGALWDIDFVQWRKCFEAAQPQFALHYAESLDELLQMLKSNRHNFFLRDPGAASDERWSIKDTGDESLATRDVLKEMSSIWNQFPWGSGFRYVPEGPQQSS